MDKNIDVTKIKRLPDKIIDKLFLGAMFDSNQKEGLQFLGVTHILIAGNNLAAHYPNDFKYLQLPIDDSDTQGITEYFNASYDFIKEGIETGGCFVHCAFGVSRSASIIISYLMRENKWKFDETFEFVKKQRRVIGPNCGFQNELRRYEVTLSLSSKEEVDEIISKKQFYFSKYS
jgi:protein-tyrosine phosphatase